MVVLHDFTPCVDDELEVKRGQLVNILYRENDWVYVIGQDSRQEGFIPFSYCAPYNTQLADLAVKKKLPREQPEQPHDENQPLLGGVGVDNKLDVLCDEAIVVGNPAESSLHVVMPECTPFIKEPSGRCIVLYTFIARDENDLSVERGEFVTVLNREDPDWFWIMRSDGQEGFVPAKFIYPADSVRVLQQQKTAPATTTAAPLNESNIQHHATLTAGGLSPMESILQQQQQQQGQQAQQQQQQLGIGTDDLRYHGTELVMLYDYKAQAPDDLSVRRGDWIYADLNNQTVDGWLWAYAPKTRKYGFIPKAYARPPAMTSL